MKNLEIKLAMKKCNLKQWELAEMLEILEFTLSRRMRKELPKEEKDRIIEIIRKGGEENGR